MDNRVALIFIGEINAQCHFALNAIGALNNVVGRRMEAGLNGDLELGLRLHREIFRTLHSFLTHSSNISRLVWPIKLKKHRGETNAIYSKRWEATSRYKRGKHIRDMLGIGDNENILQSRKLRDHLEHLDERLDDWYSNSINKNFVQDHIGPLNGIGGVDKKDIMRLFDPSSGSMYFRGEIFSLNDMAGAVEDIHNKVNNLNITQ